MENGERLLLEGMQKAIAAQAKSIEEGFGEVHKRINGLQNETSSIRILVVGLATHVDPKIPCPKIEKDRRFFIKTMIALAGVCVAAAGVCVALFANFH